MLCWFLIIFIIYQVRIAILIGLAFFIKAINLFISLGLVIASSFKKFFYIVVSLFKRLIHNFLLLGRITRVLGPIGCLQYVFIFKVLHTMKMVHVFFVLFSTVMSIAVLYNQHAESIISCIFYFLDFEFYSIVFMYNGESSASGASNSGGTNPAGGPSSGGGPNPGGGPDPNGYTGDWRPYNYKDHPNKRGIEVIPYIHTDYILNTYNPEGDIPPKNDRELSLLLEYRFDHNVRHLGYQNWNVDKAFPDDSIVDKISRARLYNHIYDNKKYLPSTFTQMDPKSDTTPWDQVKITSHLINSLQTSIQ